MAFFGLYKSKEEKRKEQDLRDQSELEQKLYLQREWGDELYLALSDAAKENEVFNVLSDGTKVDRIGPIQVEAMEHNGGRYSVIVSLPDPKCFTGDYPVLHADVDVRNDNLHVFFGPYVPDRDYGIGTRKSFDEEKKELSDYVKKYSLFGK